MFSSGFSEMLIDWDDADLMFFAMGGQQCKEPQPQQSMKRVHVEPVAQCHTLLDDYYICSPPKKPKHSREWGSGPGEAEESWHHLVKSREAQAFHKLLDDAVINEFLQADSCRKMSDKYLLAMVFAYFKRADYRIHEFTRLNFFVALFLANDMEEDEEDVKYDIFAWALGTRWKFRYQQFLRKRDKLWRRTSYRAVVSKKCCEEIMKLNPTHPAWKRERPEHHGGATRVYLGVDEEPECYVRGPDDSPRRCNLCCPPYSGQHDSGYFDEGSSWYFSHSSSSESESSPRQEIFCVEPTARTSHRFDMQGLKNTLQHDDSFFATEE